MIDELETQTTCFFSDFRFSCKCTSLKQHLCHAWWRSQVRSFFYEM